MILTTKSRIKEYSRIEDVAIRVGETIMPGIMLKIGNAKIQMTLEMTPGERSMLLKQLRQTKVSR